MRAVVAVKGRRTGVILREHGLRCSLLCCKNQLTNARILHILISRKEFDNSLRIGNERKEYFFAEASERSCHRLGAALASEKGSAFVSRFGETD